MSRWEVTAVRADDTARREELLGSGEWEPFAVTKETTPHSADVIWLRRWVLDLIEASRFGDVRR